jgi:hypothetical protein
MMHCPQCKAEYRFGYTRCADCGVELVANLPGTKESNSKDVPSGGLVPLWEGEDLALHATLLKELEAAEIRYFDQPMGTTPGVRRMVPFPVQPMVQFGYQVAVLSSDLAPAQGILEKLLEEEPEDMSLPADDKAQEERPERPGPGVEAKTCEVWAGSEESMAEFLADALRENGVPARREDIGEETKLYVASADEASARKILREIREGVPPS